MSIHVYSSWQPPCSPQGLSELLRSQLCTPCWEWPSNAKASKWNCNDTVTAKVLVVFASVPPLVHAQRTSAGKTRPEVESIENSRKRKRKEHKSGVELSMYLAGPIDSKSIADVVAKAVCSRRYRPPSCCPSRTPTIKFNLGSGLNSSGSEF